MMMIMILLLLVLMMYDVWRWSRMMMPQTLMMVKMYDDGVRWW